MRISHGKDASVKFACQRRMVRKAAESAWTKIKGKFSVGKTQRHTAAKKMPFIQLNGNE
jgi:hypothetical protein